MFGNLFLNLDLRGKKLLFLQYFNKIFFYTTKFFLSFLRVKDLTTLIKLFPKTGFLSKRPKKG